MIVTPLAAPPVIIEISALSRLESPSGSSGSTRSGRPASPMRARVPPGDGITTPPLARGLMSGVLSVKPSPAILRNFVTELVGMLRSKLRLFHQPIMLFSIPLKLFPMPSHIPNAAFLMRPGSPATKVINSDTFVETPLRMSFHLSVIHDHMPEAAVFILPGSCAAQMTS